MDTLDALARLRRGRIANALADIALERLADRLVPPIPADAIVDLDAARDVLLVTSRRGRNGFHAETWSLERAYGLELAARARTFAVTDDPAEITGKRVLWAHPSEFVRPALWDHARQVREFAAGLEAQGNELYPSSAETAFWENKAHMHRRLDEVGAATPPTRVLGASAAGELDLEDGPTLTKAEHGAGSDGIVFHPDRAAARRHLAAHAFRPGESVIAQSIVSGATRDLRLTMVGDRAMALSTYWRVKDLDRARGAAWVSTATTYGSTVVHEPPPPAAVTACARIMADLGVRTAGFDLMWEHDDVDGTPLVLELSPFYQPNPPKPGRHADDSYKTFKRRRFRADGYYENQHRAHREIAAATFDQGLF